MTTRVCPVCAALAKNLRVLHANEEAELKRLFGSKPTPPEHPLPDDGRTFGIKPKPPAPALAGADS